jgi:hypothetical protein
VSGNVYNDLDGNGLKTGHEPGLANWVINLEDSSGTVLASVNSDANGNYSFTGVGSGSYQVAEVQQTNWVQTQPLYPTVYSFTVQSGHNLIALNFGNHYAPFIGETQVIDNGQAGYSETGTWSTVVGGFNGTNRVARTVHSGGATATATWDFTGVTNSLVDVWVTYAGKSNYSHAAPFKIYDGGTSLGTQSIDEHILVTDTSHPQSQGSYGGVGWLELGSFVINNGEVKVVLNNLASGNFVDADGVLIVDHGGGKPVGLGPAPIIDSTTVSSTKLPIGTLDVSQVTGGSNTKNGSANGTGNPLKIAISGVTQAPAINVVYSEAPTQGGTTTVGILDTALSQTGNGSTDKNGTSDVITSLAKDLLSGKNGKA